MFYGLDDFAWIKEQESSERNANFKSYICSKNRSKRTKSKKKRGKKGKK